MCSQFKEMQDDGEGVLEMRTIDSNILKISTLVFLGVFGVKSDSCFSVS